MLKFSYSRIVEKKAAASAATQATATTTGELAPGVLQVQYIITVSFLQ